MRNVWRFLETPSRSWAADHTGGEHGEGRGRGGGDVDAERRVVFPAPLHLSGRSGCDVTERCGEINNHRDVEGQRDERSGELGRTGRRD